MNSDAGRRAGGRWRAGSLLLVVTAGGIASPALAQKAANRIQQIDFSLEVRHDDNVAHANRERALERGLKISDEKAILGANVLVSRMIGRHSLDLNAFAGYDFYRRNTQLNRERIEVSANAGINAGPCTAFLQPNFQRRQSDLAEIAVVNLPGIRSVKNVQTTQVYRSELHCGRVNGIRPFASYERSMGDNSNVVRKLSDYRGERYGGGVGYSNPTLGHIELSYERQGLDYPNRAALLPGALAGYQLQDFKIAAGRDIGRMLTIDGFVSRTLLRPRNSTAPPFKGLSWSAIVTLAPSDQFRIQGVYGKSITPSLGVDALYSVNRDIGLDASYYLSSRTSITLKGSRARRTFAGASDEIGPLLTNYRLDKFAARVNFSPNPRLKFHIEGGHERRTSNAVFYNYSNTFVALNTTFTLGAQ